MLVYSEFDPFAADWLENLIAAGELPEGAVDRRDIRELKGTDCGETTHLFSGIGGWPLALRLAGWPNDHPIWTGSCPCQPYSTAGKALGDADPRNLWPEMFRLIRECRPECVLGEQVPGAIGHGWLDGVCADLEGEGYAVGAVVLGAHSVGAPHIRQRLFWVANRTGGGCPEQQAQPRAARGWSSGHADGSSGSGRLDDPRSNGARHQHPKPTKSRRHGTNNGILGQAGGGAGRVAESEGDRAARDIRDGESETEPLAGSDGAGRGEMVGLHGAFGHCAHNPWSRCHLILCRDGKWRQVSSQPGDEPLAHGIPRELGQGQPALAAVARSARRNRVGRLRGYGNAIVPQVAALFVRAVMEIMGVATSPSAA